MPEVYNTDLVLAPVHNGSALGIVQPVEFRHSAAERRKYLPVLGLFGTAGNPDEVYDWRADTIPTIKERLAERGITRAGIYNPLKREWRPEDAPEEAHNLARDAVLLLPVLDLTSGHASLGETGFAALGGTLRPQKIHMFIDRGLEKGVKVARARNMTILMATKTLSDFPVNVTMAKDMASMVNGSIQDIADFTESMSSRVLHENRYVIERRTDLDPRIALVGSGASEYADSWHRSMGTLLQNAEVSQAEQYSAFVKDWTEDDALTELEHKTNDAVVLFVVTENQDSYAAMGELGWLVTYCVLNGQKLGVYVESHNSDPRSDQNRQRKLAMAHLGRHLLDFPDLPVFIANSPSELARYGASELAKYKQLQKASRASV
jgi:hypothetical protein